MSDSYQTNDAYNGGGGTSPSTLDLYVKKDTSGALQSVNTQLNHTTPSMVKSVDLSDSSSEYFQTISDKDGAELYPTLIRFSEKKDLVSEAEQLVKDDTLSGLYKSFFRKIYRFLKNDFTAPIISTMDYYYDSILGRAVFKDTYGEFARIGGAGNGAQILTTFQTFDATICNTQANNSGSTGVLNVVSFTPSVNTGETNKNGVFVLLPNSISAGNTIQASVFEEDPITKNLTCIIKASKTLASATQGFVILPNTNVLSGALIKVGYVYWVYAFSTAAGVLGGFLGAINAGSPQGDAGNNLGAVTSALALSVGGSIAAASRMNGTGRIWARLV